MTMGSLSQPCCLHRWDLPKDPALEDFKHMKPAFGASPPSSESGSPTATGARPSCGPFCARAASPARSPAAGRRAGAGLGGALCPGVSSPVGVLVRLAAQLRAHAVAPPPPAALLRDQTSSGMVPEYRLLGEQRLRVEPHQQSCAPRPTACAAQMTRMVTRQRLSSSHPRTCPSRRRVATRPSGGCARAAPPPAQLPMHVSPALPRAAGCHAPSGGHVRRAAWPPAPCMREQRECMPGWGRRRWSCWCEPCRVAPWSSCAWRLGEAARRQAALEAAQLRQRMACAQEIFRFLSNPRKPCILAMSRPDAKKNITTLVKAFGEHPQLRKLANLVLIMVRTRRQRCSDML